MGLLVDLLFYYLADVMVYALFGKTDGISYCLGLTAPVGYDDISVYPEETRSPGLPVVYSFNQGTEPHIKEHSPCLCVICAGD